VRAASTAVKAHAAALGVQPLRFNSVMMAEPPKAALLAYEHGRGPVPDRAAHVVLIAPKLGPVGTVIEARVALPPLGSPPEALAAGSPAVAVVAWQELPGVQPMTTPDDNATAEEIMKADPEVRRLLRERYAITDMASVACDTWACHGAPDHLNHRRLMQGFLYVRTRPGDNEYAHPIDLVPIVDLNAGRVVHVDMYDRPPPVPMTEANYHRDLAPPDRPFRTDLRPLDVVQPLGPSFTVEGSLVRWQKWRVRVGFNAREGLVLHNLGYEEGGRVRPVMHRASLVEMIVPYGDPNYPYVRKSALDVGDYGLGFCANSLALGCDCLGHIRYFDAVLNSADGEPLLVKNAVCMHEEDAGILYKHFDCRSGHTEVRRARRLVISSISTFMNYEYLSYWHLYQDGSIAFELKLSGILSTSVAPLGEAAPAHGVRVSPGVNATVHQHFFCMRLDPAIDDEEGGRHVVVAEVDAVPLPPGPGNPHANGFIMRETDLTRTAMAARDVNFAAARCWKLKNPRVTNPVSGEAVSYRLLPGVTPAMMAGPGSLVRRRGAFATHNLWVTPHRDDQRYPAGDHVVQSKECMGLARWMAHDQPLAGADPVVWYSYGITHNPRIEDFPVMPVEVVGFHLKPSSFFTANPALDLPPEVNKASREAHKQAAAAAASGAPGTAAVAGGACCGSGVPHAASGALESVAVRSRL